MLHRKNRFVEVSKNLDINLEIIYLDQNKYAGINMLKLVAIFCSISLRERFSKIIFRFVLD